MYLVNIRRKTRGSQWVEATYAGWLISESTALGIHDMLMSLLDMIENENVWEKLFGSCHGNSNNMCVKF
jgi:hypothetical protein